MAKASIDTGAAGEPVHTRTTAGTDESQAVVVAIDGADTVVPADATNGLSVDVKRVAGSADLATGAKQDTGNTSLAAILAAVDGLEGFTDGLEAALATLNGKDFSSQTTLAAVLTELGQKLEPGDLAALATAAKQDAAKAVLDAIAAALAGTLTVGLPTGAATGAKQDTAAGKLDTLIAKDYATQTTLAAVLTELGQKLEPGDLSALATAAKQDSAKTALDTIAAALAGTLTVGLPAGASTAAKQDDQTAALGATGDASSASTIIGRLKKLVELLTTTASSFLSVRLSDGSSYLGTVSDRLKVDVGGSLPAGSNAIGKLAANSGVDIGDVDVTSLPALPTGTNSIGTVKAPDTAPGNIRKTVTTHGTAVVLNGSALRIRRGVVCALSTNTGVVVVGGSGVIAAVGTRNSPYLNAGDTLELGTVDLGATYIDSTVDGEGVTVYYEA